MAFITSSAQNLEQVPPHSVNIRDISISAELSSVPRLTGEQQRKRLSVHNIATNMRYSPFFRVTFNASLLQQKLIDLSIY